MILRILAINRRICPMFSIMSVASLLTYNCLFTMANYERGIIQEVLGNRDLPFFRSGTEEHNEADTGLSSSIRIAVRLERLTVSDLAFSWCVDSHRTLSIICVERKTPGNGVSAWKIPHRRHKRHCSIVAASI